MAGDPFRKFELDLAKWCDQAEGKMNAFVREFANDIAFQIVSTTPVLTGFCRAHWNSYLNDEYKDTQVTPKGAGDKGASYPNVSDIMNSMTATIAGAIAGDTIHIYNNCKYVRVLEDGFGDRPARNFVKGAMANADNIADKVLARIGATK